VTRQSKVRRRALRPRWLAWYRRAPAFPPKKHVIRVDFANGNNWLRAVLWARWLKEVLFWKSSSNFKRVNDEQQRGPGGFPAYPTWGPCRHPKSWWYVRFLFYTYVFLISLKNFKGRGTQYKILDFSVILFCFSLSYNYFLLFLYNILSLNHSKFQLQNVSFINEFIFTLS